MKNTGKRIIATMCCMGILAGGYVSLARAQAPEETGARTEETGVSVEGTEAQAEEQARESFSSPTILAGGGEQDNGGGPGMDVGEAQAGDMIRIWGPVLGVEDQVIRIDNQSGVSYAGEIVLNISEEYSRVLDAENGYPVQLDEIQKGDFIYAYIGPAMTMSLPPMTTAEMVICQMPEDFRAPDYVRVKSMQQKADGSWSLTATEGTVYPVPSDCQILPYLTRNLVRLSDVTESSTCLIWTDEMGSVQKIVLFDQSEMF